MKTILKGNKFSKIYVSRLMSCSFGVAEMIGRSAADQYLKTMDSKFIDTPTICITDPANNASKWEWTAGLDWYYCSNFTVY